MRARQCALSQFYVLGQFCQNPAPGFTLKQIDGALHRRRELYRPRNDNCAVGIIKLKPLMDDAQDTHALCTFDAEALHFLVPRVDTVW